MKPEPTTPEPVAEELRFFGRVTASVTHQIKNELAVINETGNLIGEIMAMAEQGREFDPGRIRELAQRVVKRVENSNRVVKMLNKFAHSAESVEDRADGLGTLELMAGLYEWQAGFKKIGLNLEPFPGEEPPQVGVNPFLLERILWNALEAAVEESPTGGRVGLSLEGSGEKPLMRLRGEFAKPPAPSAPELMTRASVRTREEKDSLCLELPS